ncbi:precorrin-2/cobalt-factor-2 C20-methyltransferase [Lachnospiraceae bacterium XBB1006]|nr:precorrin-2/cobalt-factor-2 C20-methyltransferase [Lachnospiraceae bacterium XBB1006]
MKQKGKVYGVGVGPGDPELMTLKAVRVIRENEVIAIPGDVPEKTKAYGIAVEAVPELKTKELVPVSMPMIKDRAQLEQLHETGAKQIASYLEQGRNVVFLTLGDPTIYSTFSYLQRYFMDAGYEVEIVSGIPSFCAAAARLRLPLAEWEEPIHILPALHLEESALIGDGNYVLMKSASHMGEVKNLLRNRGLAIQAVENCGMQQEVIYHSLAEIPDDAGYFSIIIAKESV